ncbi:MAG: PepSY domain-containing protein [Gammaproteobacteria bacterium]
MSGRKAQGRPFRAGCLITSSISIPGEKIGTRQWGEVSLAKENILSFLYRLHYTLALPEGTGNLGGYVLGITALLWTLDCFVGVYLTLPAGRRRDSLPPGFHNL